MAIATILERVDAIYSTDATAAPEELRTFMSGIQASHEHASKLFARYALTFVVAWAICHALGIGIIREGTIAAFKFADVKSALIAAPVTLGMLSYLMFSKLAFAEFLLAGIERSYRYRLPHVYAQGLSQLVAFPSIFNIERNLQGERYEAAWLTKFTSIWIGTGAICLVIVPLVALGHVSYLLVRTNAFTTLSVVVSVVSGVVLWLRGVTVLLMYAAIERR